MSNILDKFLTQCKRPQRKVQLPWVSDAVRLLIKKRDFALITFFVKTRYDTDLILTKRNQTKSSSERTAQLKIKLLYENVS